MAFKWKLVKPDSSAVIWIWAQVWFHNRLSDFRPHSVVTPVPVFFQVVWQQQGFSCTVSEPSIRGKPDSPSCLWEDASLLRALLSSPLSSVCLPQLWKPNSEDGAKPSLHPDQPRQRAALNWSLMHLRDLISLPVMVNSKYCRFSVLLPQPSKDFI